MGQKVQPHGIRLGISKDWNARWFARNSDYAANLTSDMRIRGHLRGKKSLANAAVSRIAIERPAQDVVHIKIFTARPGIVIEANTTYGVVGVKVWIFKGEVFQEEQKPLVGAADDTGYYSENPAAPVLADEPQMVESENPAHGLDLDN